MAEAIATGFLGTFVDSPERDRRDVLLAISGDRQAFASLVASHQNYVFSLLRRNCGDPTLAEDLAQATFLKAWQQLGDLRDPGAFRGWLRRVALNILVDSVRRAGPPHITLLDISDEPHHASSESTAIRTLDIGRALARLSFAQRTCIVLAYDEGMTHNEIAASLKIPLGTVKSHILRGLAQLRCLMQSREDPNGRI